jgi:hypothetical protein
MKLFPYTYCVVRYVPDSAAGEMLNVGVVISCPDLEYLGARFEHRYERLSHAFAGFDGSHYKRVLQHFERALEKLHERQAPLLFVIEEKKFPDAREATMRLWSDSDLAFQVGPVLAGISEDPVLALQEVFDRMVGVNNLSHRSEKRTDEDVWNSVYRKPLVNFRLQGKLHPWTLAGEDFEFKFDFTFQNEKRHILEPVSMDYVQGDWMQRKATLLLGSAAAMSGHPDLGVRYLLMGRPRRDELLNAYDRAKNILHKMPVKHEIIEEDGAEDFARFLMSYMREHGILEEEVVE